jgi:hypothetical protein
VCKLLQAYADTASSTDEELEDFARLKADLLDMHNCIDMTRQFNDVSVHTTTTSSPSGKKKSDVTLC